MVTKRISMWMTALASLIFLPGGLNKKIRSLTVKPGDSVTLQTGLTGLDGGHILWIYDSSRRLLLCSDGNISDPPEEYEGRLDLDPSSGSLTISNVRKSAVYRGEMLSGNEKLVFDYSVIVEADPRVAPPFDSAADPRSLWGLILAAAAVCFELKVSRRRFSKVLDTPPARRSDL